MPKTTLQPVGHLKLGRVCARTTGISLATRTCSGPLETRPDDETQKLKPQTVQDLQVTDHIKRTSLCWLRCCWSCLAMTSTQIHAGIYICILYIHDVSFCKPSLGLGLSYLQSHPVLQCSANFTPVRFQRIIE